MLSEVFIMFYPLDLSCTHTKLIFIELTNLALEIAKLIRACDGFPHSKSIVKKMKICNFIVLLAMIITNLGMMQILLCQVETVILSLTYIP